MADVTKPASAVESAPAPQPAPAPVPVATYVQPQPPPPQPQVVYQQPQVTYVQQPAVVVQQSAGLQMVHYARGVPAGPLVCPYCRATVSTTVSMQPGLLTWLICGGLCLIGCWPCAPVAFCVDSCHDTCHSCPSCNVVLGIAPAMG